MSHALPLLRVHPERHSTSGALRPMPALIGLLLLVGPLAQANNIRVTNVGLARQDAVTKTANVTFDLAWENSWRNGDNRDAAWVFVKFRAPGSNAWEHALLSTNSAAHKAASNSAISAAADGLGVFIHGAADFAGNVNYRQVKLRWNYGANGYDFAEGALVDVSVHAVEMVFIPEGAFFLGSGGLEKGHFYRCVAGGAITNCFLVDSESEITVGSSAGNLFYVDVPDCGDGAGPISNDYPKGFAAFYCMKYELSQGQYADFLNTLTSVQAGARDSVVSINRYTISGVYPGFVAGAPDRACNWLSWNDLAAYADWAALRPMTELEYEKACRGTAQPVKNEFAWGSTSVTAVTNEVGVAGSGTETALPVNANCNKPPYFDNRGPVRVGMFAAGGATRVGSGAGYYGVMELCGNIVEWTVNAGTSAGRAFTGLHGDGVLAANGSADVAGWPGATAVGSGIRDSANESRGGLWWYVSAGGAVSDRRYINYTRTDSGWVSGGRAVRTAP